MVHLLYPDDFNSIIWRIYSFVSGKRRILRDAVTNEAAVSSCWSFCSYMVRSRKGIEMLVNLINISYCAMKLLPYQEENFSAYRSESVQDFRFFISQKIQEQIFYVSFVKNIETGIKSTWLVNAIKRLVGRQGYHL